jgi:tetraacyldisaccharide 4'-kinase
MGGTGDELEKWGADVIFGRARGPMAALARIFLRGLSFIYWFLIKFRLKAFRQHWIEQSNLGTMTISVGNLTVGGRGRRRWWSCYRGLCGTEGGMWRC